MRTIVRALLLVAGLLSFHDAIFSQQVAKQIPNAISPDGRIGFLQFTPSDYGTQKHPLIIFLHGIGERGNGTSQLPIVANNAIPLYCGRGGTMRFTVNGETSSFVVLSPQLSASYGYWPTFYIKEMIKYAKANLQIDPNRIYLTGLSLGGGGVWRSITDTENFDNTFDAGIAAAAPVCGTQEENDYDFCNTIGANHLPVWAFHSMDDATVWVGSTQHAEVLAKNCGLNPAAKFTYYQTGNHSGAWVNAYDTGHITRTTIVNGVATSFTANPNLYEWLLMQKRSGDNTQPSYTAPVANAGIAQIITLPISLVTLTGSGTGTNGATISSYSWTKTSGPAGGAITLPLLNTTLVTGLVQGTYVFTLTVTDNHGLSSSSSVTVTVNPLLNQAPAANAGSNTTVTLPTNTATLNGSASSDPDGTIVSYNWSKTSGPDSYTITAPGAATTALSNLEQGVYVFALQVKDNAGAISGSTVTVTVNAEAVAPSPPSNNQLPLANAGYGATITLPVNSVILDGSASYDPDGTIAAYYWVQKSGPSSFKIADATAARTSLSDLTEGLYVFNLQVRDNAGALSISSVTIIVASANNKPPVSNAGSNISIALPANSVTLDGSASYDPDGTIAAYYWVQNSGPSSNNIGDAGAVKTVLTNLVQGVYSFTLQVRDNAGIISFSSVTVTVGSAAVTPPPPVVAPPAGPNQAPVSNAGPNVIITLPTNSITLDGSASYDPDGSIAEYYWVQNSGPAAANISVIANIRAAKTTLSNLIQGVYIFTLQVKDNNGVPAYSMKKVIVNAGLSAPPPPAATTNNLLGYIKVSYGPNYACADASATGRIPIYGSSIANGNTVYADAALTQKYNGGWNWFSFTPVLGGPVTQAFAIYPLGNIGLLTPCTSNIRTAASEEALSNGIRNATEAGKLSMYPNPVHTSATIQLTSDVSSVKIINLYNASGVLIAKYTWQVIKGNNIFSLKNITDLGSGLYIIDIRDTNGTPNGKLKFIKM